VHPANATSAQITETNHQYAAEYTLYHTVNEELKKQVLATIPILYLAILSDDEMGFMEVTCDAVLEHLRTMYGAITQAELETNHNRLSADWLPEDPIKDLWLCIREIQCFTLAGHEPISDSPMALRLTLEVLEKTGLFLSASECWRKLDEATWMLSSFQLHFTRADKECHHKLTAQIAYHGAHLITMPNIDLHAAATVTITPSTPLAASFSVNVDGSMMMYYYWLHGLGCNANHTSPTCNNKAHRHQDTTTVNNCMGGSNIIMGGGCLPRHMPPAAIVPAPAAS
jgi:hypothetical protein